MNIDDDYESDDDFDDEDNDYDEDLDDEDDWDFEDEDEDIDDEDVDIEECIYTSTGSCEDCTLPEDKECPYSAEEDLDSDT